MPDFCLHHHPLDPPSRRVRLTLGEKNLPFETITERPWAPRPEFQAINPSGEVPVLVIKREDSEKNGDKTILADATAICEYLDETNPTPPLLGDNPCLRAEIRRLVNWFEHKMYAEATQPLVGEKAMKRLQGGGEPDSLAIRAACHNIHGHLDYIGWLTARRNWLAGDTISLADLSAAAQLSAIDYLGDVPWDRHAEAKEWYARIKSRPSFRALLGDHIAGLLPPRHYADLDF